ncbi:MAG: hypothetical protein A4E23_01501 [Methanomethylovorans sp. PtaU1.Bin073]|nr:MAG: hypothetical protein A4E23_01501 [Methanomethylovorans sp. PtaU1.Bin073]
MASKSAPDPFFIASTCSISEPASSMALAIFTSSITLARTFTDTIAPVFFTSCIICCNFGRLCSSASPTPIFVISGCLQCASISIIAFAFFTIFAASINGSRVELRTFMATMLLVLIDFSSFSISFRGSSEMNSCLPLFTISDAACCVAVSRLYPPSTTSPASFANSFAKWLSVIPPIGARAMGFLKERFSTFILKRSSDTFLPLINVVLLVLLNKCKLHINITLISPGLLQNYSLMSLLK